MTTLKILLKLTVNGEARQALVHPMARLLDVIREDFGLTGTKEGCGEGECGACSVILDGSLVNACLVPAIQAQGSTMRTVEGLAGVDLSPLQQAFLHHGGAQCGFCTPGMLVAGTYLLETDAVQDEDRAREGLSGNLCRCTGYVKIVDALLAAREGRP
jgi:aerobic-type carbon monoxide dehydrogenase small subunit (CoxS/CutS family)